MFCPQITIFMSLISRFVIVYEYFRYMNILAQNFLFQANKAMLPPPYILFEHQ